MFAMFLQHQARKLSKTPLFRKHSFFDVFSTKGPKCNTTTHRCFLHFYYFRLPSNSVKNTGICSVLRRQHVKQRDVLKQFHTFFQLRLLKSKSNYFWLRFCHRSSGVKYLKSKNGHLFVTIFATEFHLKELGEAVCAKKCCKFLGFIEHTMHFTCSKSRPHPLLLVLPERHALCTYQCRRILPSCIH